VGHSDPGTLAAAHDGTRACDQPSVESRGEVCAEVAAAAAAEGLTLIRSERSVTGFKHVSRDPVVISKPFQLRINAGNGKVANLGYFARADEAALAYARRVGPEASAKEQQQLLRCMMTSEQALAEAEAEGLTLVTSTCASGYRHVTIEGRPDHSRRYRLQIREGHTSRPRCSGRTAKTGVYATAEEAALEAARFYAHRTDRP
jgi:hypothetical protein